MPADMDNVATFPDQMHRQWKVFEDMFIQQFRAAGEDEAETRIALDTLKPIFMKHARTEWIPLHDSETALQMVNNYMFVLATGLMTEILIRETELQRLRRRDT